MRARDLAHELKQRATDPRVVPERFGLERSKTERGKWMCPSHGGGSLHVSLGPDHTLRCKCFGGCALAGDVLDLAAAAGGFDRDRQFRDVLRFVAAAIAAYDLLDELDEKPVDERRPAPPPRPLPPPKPAPAYPSIADVRAVLELGGDVAQDAPASAMLRARAIDPDLVDLFQIARVIPCAARLPSWATFRGDPWTVTGHRLVIPVVDAAGVIRSVRAWRVGAGDSPKRLPPSGHKAAGLVLADRTAIAMLRGQAEPELVVVVEGEPDFATWATRFSDSDPNPPAVLGVLSGSWTVDHARRIPVGARVVIRTHRDEAGERYALEIARSLGTRCRLLRATEAA